MKNATRFAVGIVMALGATGAAHAEMPTFSATCPQQNSIDADRTGTVRVNGAVANVNKFNENYYEATSNGITFTISHDPDGSNLLVGYQPPGSAGGYCTIVSSAPAQSADAGSSGPALVATNQGTSGSEARTVNVRFPTGSTGTVFNDSIQGYQSVNYELDARAGQTLTVRMDTNNASSYFNVFEPGATDAIHNGSVYGNRFSGVLSRNGTYRIQVYLMRNAARRNEVAGYTLHVDVIDAPSLATMPGSAGRPDFADGESGGPDWWQVSTQSGSLLSLRAGPGTWYERTGALSDGAIVRNLGCQVQDSLRWCQVEGPEGNGWAAGRFLHESAAPTQIRAVARPLPPPSFGGAEGGPDWWQVSTRSGAPLNMRFGPSAQSLQVDSIPHGTVVRNLGCRYLGAVQWCRVAYRGQEGWSSAQFLIESGPPNQTAPLPPPTPAYDRGGPDFWMVRDVPPDYLLNIRTGPSTKHDVIARLDNGTIVGNLGCQFQGSARWCRVRLMQAGDLEGWASTRYLTETTPPRFARAVPYPPPVLTPGFQSNRPVRPTFEAAPDIVQRDSGEIEVRFDSGCTMLFNRQGGLITAGASCAFEQRSSALDAARTYVRQTPGFAPSRTVPRTAGSGSDASGVAVNACLNAVANQTNERNVSVLSTEFSEANSLVMVGVGGNRAPWRCLVSNNGVVQEVMFTGDDSAGVPSPQASAPSRPAPSGSDVSRAAVNACLNAVANQTNERNVSVLSSEFSEANSMVMVGVGANRAPWRCLVSNNGVVQDVMFTGDDSAGVPSPQASAPSPTGGGTDVAEEACLIAVANEVGIGRAGVSTIDVQEAEAGIGVTVRVRGAQAPWSCLSDTNGNVQGVSFTGSDSGGVPASAPQSAGGRDVAVEACLAAVANQVGVARSEVSTIEVLEAEAGFGVTVQVPGAERPWSCLSDNAGNVQGVTYMGEG